MRERALKAHPQGLSPELHDGDKANINERNKAAKSEEEKPPVEMEWRRDGSSWLWHTAEGEFVIAPRFARGCLGLASSPLAQKIRATVKLIGGPVYTAREIDRLHYGPKPPG